MDKSLIISNAVSDLLRRSQDELDPVDSVMLFEVSYVSLVQWISFQRLNFLPPVGSSYDKVLAWAKNFVESGRTFCMAIEKFVDNVSLACQLAYGFCGMLLEVCSG